MIIFTIQITPRLRYIVDFFQKEIFGEDLQITTDIETFRNHDGPRINYSGKRSGGSEFFIGSNSLLFEEGIHQREIRCFDAPSFQHDKKSYKAFFQTEGDIPFDIFAASFYLLSRYEEYLPHQKDIYGRYAHENSLAFREKFLHLPLVNIWVDDFKARLRSFFPRIDLKTSNFLFLPTYDIDIAWSYRHKGWTRNAGAMLGDILKGNWSLLKERMLVLRCKKRDPFDAFGWLNQLHQQFQLKPYYFFLLADRPGKYDKNISPANKAMKALIQDHLIRYPVGIHPSWQSGDSISLLDREINTLSVLTGNPVRSSRQHYIRFTIPETLRLLQSRGIEYEFSMGYGSINGFRASVATAYNWYDLEKESATSMMLFPFCFMEANSFYEQKYSAREALEEMKNYYEAVSSVNGMFIMIWHNSFLGTDKLYAGWREIYQEFIESTK